MQQKLPNLPTVQQQTLPGNLPINIKAKSFKPSDGQMGFPAHSLFQQQIQNPIFLDWQKIIDQKITDAKANKQQRLRFEDLIEDSSLEQPPQNVIDQIKLKCNNTGKNNFKQNLEAIRDLVLKKPDAAKDEPAASEEAAPGDAAEEKPKAQSEVNLLWFINYILTKRISGQNQTLHHIYIELIRQIGHDDSV